MTRFILFSKKYIPVRNMLNNAGVAWNGFGLQRTWTARIDNKKAYIRLFWVRPIVGRTITT